MVEMVLLGKSNSVELVRTSNGSIRGHEWTSEAYWWSSDNAYKTVAERSVRVQTWFLGHCWSGGGRFLRALRRNFRFRHKILQLSEEMKSYNSCSLLRKKKSIFLKFSEKNIVWNCKSIIGMMTTFITPNHNIAPPFYMNYDAIVIYILSLHLKIYYCYIYPLRWFHDLSHGNNLCTHVYMF